MKEAQQQARPKQTPCKHKASRLKSARFVFVCFSRFMAACAGSLARIMVVFRFSLMFVSHGFLCM
jgi:hypothetical protein